MSKWFVYFVALACAIVISFSTIQHAKSYKLKRLFVPRAPYEYRLIVYKETEYDRAVYRKCQKYVHDLVLGTTNMPTNEFWNFIGGEIDWCWNSKGYLGARYKYDDLYEEYDGSI